MPLKNKNPSLTRSSRASTCSELFSCFWNVTSPKTKVNLIKYYRWLLLSITINQSSLSFFIICKQLLKIFKVRSSPHPQQFPDVWYRYRYPTTYYLTYDTKYVPSQRLLAPSCHHEHSQADLEWKISLLLFSHAFFALLFHFIWKVDKWNLMDWTNHM